MRFCTLLLPATLACALLSGAAHAGPCDAHFTFDGNLIDASGNGYDGRLIGKGGGAATDAASYGEGRNGQALLLSGVYAVRAPVDLSKEVCPQITVAAWVRMDDDPTKGTQDIFSSGRGGPRFDRTGTHLEVRSGDQRQLVSNGLRGGRWEFIATVVDQEAGKMTVYWRQRSFERDMKPVGTKSPDIWIGALDDDLRNPVLAGAIDDVRIYGQLLTADQIKQIQVGIPRQPGSRGLPGDQYDSRALPGDQYDPAQLPGDQYDPTALPGDQYDPAQLPGDQYDPRALPGDQYDPAQLPGDQYDPRALPGDQYDPAQLPGDQYDSGQSDQGSTLIHEPGQPAPSVLQGDSGSSSTQFPGDRDLSSDTVKDLQQATDKNSPLEFPPPAPEGNGGGSEEPAAEATTSSSGYTLSDDVVKSGVVGKSGTSVRPLDLRSEPFHKILIERLDWEMGHVPDRVRIIGKTKSKYALQYLTNNCPDLGNCSDDYNVVTMNEANIAPASATAIGVCLTLVDNKVAGVELRGHVLEPDGTLDEYYKDTDTRGQCANWSTLTACGLDYVATGVEVHFRETGAAANVDHKVTGLQLLCRRIVKN